MKMSAIERNNKTKNAIKSLQINLQYNSGQEHRIVAVSGCEENAEKTLISLQIAKSFANSGEKTVWLETRDDIFCKSNGKYGKEEYIQTVTVKKCDKRGLIDYLTEDESDENDILYPSSVPNLDMIYTGDKEALSTEMLSGERFMKLLQVLSKEYKNIVVDTPSMVYLADMLAVLGRCTEAVLVVFGRRTSAEVAKKAITYIDKSGCKLLGIILQQHK